jgi:hypothetical protein
MEDLSIQSVSCWLRRDYLAATGEELEEEKLHLLLYFLLQEGLVYERAFLFPCKLIARYPKGIYVYGLSPAEEHPAPLPEGWTEAHAKPIHFLREHYYSTSLRQLIHYTTYHEAWRRSLNRPIHELEEEDMLIDAGWIRHSRFGLKLKIHKEVIPSKPVNEDLESLYKHSSHHREEIARSRQCGCFSCTRLFPAEEITDYVDGGQTALCPYCGTDAVIGDACGTPLSEELMKAMKRKYF